MKYYSVMVQYGKNRTYVEREWVAENAMNKFQEEWTHTIREIFKWKKEINFRQYESHFEDGHGGEILAYTTTGRRVVKVSL